MIRAVEARVRSMNSLVGRRGIGRQRAMDRRRICRVLTEKSNRTKTGLASTGQRPGYLFVDYEGFAR
ncbi:hypothetical protein [Methylobacterium sp. CM6247]